MGDSKKWNPVSTPTDISQWMPPAICEKELVITYIESPCMFWSSLVSQISKQSDIDSKLSSMCSSLPKLKCDPVLGKTYACMYTFDNNWYRCKVTLIINKSHVEVLYVDYGNREVVEKSNLVELPPFLSDLHILAYPYWLLRLKSIRNESTIEKGIEFLENLKTHNHLTATLYSKTKDSVIPISVKLDSGQDLGELMVQKKFCTFMSDEELRHKFAMVASKSTLNRQSLERTKSLASGEASASTLPYKNPKMNSNNVDCISRTQSISNVARSNYNRSKSKSPVKLVKLRAMNGDQNSSEHNAPGDDNRMTNTAKHMLEKKNMEHGIEQLSLELTESSNEVLALQLNNSNLKQDIEIHKKNQNEMGVLLRSREAFFDNKLTTLVNYARSVYDLRLRISRQEELRLDLDRVCEMLLSMQPSTPMLRKITSVQAVFENLQNKIKDKSGVDEELNKLISARDSARKLLHSDLEEFLYKASPFPFEELFVKIKNTLRAIVRPELLDEFEKCEFLYSEESVSSVSELTEERYQTALINYRVWRSRNLKEHRFYEAKLDEKKVFITTAFSHVISVLNDDTVQVNSNCLSNVDVVVKEFEVSANEETSYLLKELGDGVEDVKMTNIPIIEDEQIKHMLVTKSGDWLWSSVDGVLHELGRVERLLRKNRTLMNQLSQWLVNVPNVSNLKEVMKVVKTLKSQLRHQLADHADLEEDKVLKGETGNEETVKIRLLNKLNQTRTSLQERLELNDDIMLSMLESDLRQFPELVIFHPDIPFLNYLAHTPIVRHGRSMDQYYLQPVISEANSFKSAYVGRAVVLQEYFLLNKTFLQFESSINSYLSCFEDQSVNRIEFIFLDSRKQTGVVQSTYREHSFGKMLSMNSDENMMLYMLYNILVDLHHMHKMGVVHCCVNPAYILYDSNNWMAFMRPYNFNLTPVERCKENTWNGIRFTAPEAATCLSDNQTPNSNDMYSFGMLMFQTHRPLQQGSSGRDIVEALLKEVSSPKIEMIKRLMADDPDIRPSAEDLLKTPFWSEVAFDYQKGKAFMMKQVAVATENSEKAVAMLIDNMQTTQAEVAARGGGGRYKQSGRHSDESSEQNDDESLDGCRKKKEKRSKVKFDVQSEESSTVEEDCLSGGDSETSKRKEADDASSFVSDDNSDAARDALNTPLSVNSDKGASGSLEERMFGVKRFLRHGKNKKAKESEEEYEEYDEDEYDSQDTNQ